MSASLAPKQEISNPSKSVIVSVIVKSSGCVIVAVLVIVQPLLSVTVSSYVPVPKLLILAVVALILVPSFFQA